MESKGKEQDFQFGIEAEYMLCDRTTFLPVPYENLDQKSLFDLIDSIPTHDFDSAGLNVKPLHTKPSPYLLEGYYLTDTNMQPQSLLPKGIEIRTPLSSSIDGTLNNLSRLHERMQNRLNMSGYRAVAISHHPTEANLQARPNYTRHDYWQWALVATTTFGPDINISLPESLADRIVAEELKDKINHYLPAVCALTFASPLYENSLWCIRDQIGKSIRTYRRSIWAPIFYIHEKPSLRFEFKGFEMSCDLADYEAYFLLSLALLLDHQLKGRASDQTRIYDLGALAVEGLKSKEMKTRAAQLLESASRIAHSLGLSDHSLETFWTRLDSNRVPADDIINTYMQRQSVADVMRSRSLLTRDNFSVGAPVVLATAV